MSKRTNRAAAKRERGKLLLDKAMQPYPRKGFVIRSQTDAMGSFWRGLVLLIVCLTLLPGRAFAEGPSLSSVEKAIAEQNLSWTPRAYKREFAFGALIEDGPSREDKEDPGLAMLPSSLDWRDNNGNWVSPVKNQDWCGSCWAFAGVGALESLQAIANNTPGTFLDLSEQILVSCTASNYGCSGGYMSVTAYYLKTQGTWLESCFSYAAADLSCGSACADWPSKAYKIDGYESVPRSLYSLKQALQYGPVQVSFRVYGDFPSYGEGVYEHATGSYQGGHAVLAVGYVDTPGSYGGGYFIVKNSWGAAWGESGYFRIGYSQVGNKVIFGRNSYRYWVDTANPTPPEDSARHSYLPAVFKTRLGR